MQTNFTEKQLKDTAITLNQQKKFLKMCSLWFL